MAEFTGFDAATMMAEAVVSYYSDKAQAQAIVNDVASLLSENAEIMITAVANIVGQAFSKAKLDRCVDLSQTLAVFWQEYRQDPSDRDKLDAIERLCQQILNELDDSDVAVGGIAHWMTVASLRVSALQEKGEFLPTGLTIAKQRARDYADHIHGQRSVVKSWIKDRYGNIKHTDGPIAGSLSVPAEFGACMCMVPSWHFKVGSYYFSGCCGHKTERKAKAARIAMRDEEVASALPPMKECERKLSEFADS